MEKKPSMGDYRRKTPVHRKIRSRKTQSSTRSSGLGLCVQYTIVSCNPRNKIKSSQVVNRVTMNNDIKQYMDSDGYSILYVSQDWIKRANEKDAGLGANRLERSPHVVLGWERSCVLPLTPHLPTSQRGNTSEERSRARRISWRATWRHVRHTWEAESCPAWLRVSMLDAWPGMDSLIIVSTDLLPETAEAWRHSFANGTFGSKEEKWEKTRNGTWLWVMTASAETTRIPSDLLHNHPSCDKITI